MKKEVILVPKDKCPLDVLAEIGEERASNAWIFLHENAYHYLVKMEGAHRSIENCRYARRVALISIVAPKVYTKFISCEVPSANGWGKIHSIEAEISVFGPAPDDPEYIYFIKMAE